MHPWLRHRQPLRNLMSQYNDKLFSGGLRKRLHTMRFRWLHHKLAGASEPFSLFELGCFDCRSLEYIPRPKRYLGADAGWEGGVSDAQMAFARSDWAQVVVAHSVHDLAPHAHERFDYSIALETLEHIPHAVLEGYLAFLAAVTKKRCYITVPVEVGPVFLAKFIAKRSVPILHSEDAESYTWREAFLATMGKVESVRRFEHKGFDYRNLLQLLSQHFTIEQVEGLPFRAHPYLSFQVGITAVPKASTPSTR
jgi:hypothetical protein